MHPQLCTNYVTPSSAEDLGARCTKSALKAMANLIFQHLWFPGTTFFCNGELVLALGFGLVGLLGFLSFLSVYLQIIYSEGKKVNNEVGRLVIHCIQYHHYSLNRGILKKKLLE